MTKNDAYKVLGVTRSAGFESAERAYRLKCRKLQRALIPGNPISVRQQAQKDLVELKTAWDIIKTTIPKRKSDKNSMPYFHSKSSCKKKPDDLFTLWELFFSEMPFRMPVILFVLVILIFWIVTLVI